LVEYITKKEFEKLCTYEINCKKCGKMLLEANSAASKRCPKCGTWNYIVIS